MSLNSLYTGAIHRISRVLFPLAQRLGLHILPNHFYNPIPDTSKLPESIWSGRSKMVGVDLREDQQLALLRNFARQYKAEYDQFPADRPAEPHCYFRKNGLFAGVDAEILYCMVRSRKPRKIYEIGSGNSTYVSAAAALKNRDEGHSCEVVAFEPYPNPILQKGFPGLTRLERTPIQSVDVSVFEQLDAGDILFIDSSHVLKIGSDVQFEFLEILPRLKPGVIVHVHDIFLPYEPPREWITRHHRFWTEQYLLQAFLTYNTRFQVLFAGQWMHRTHPDELKKAFDAYTSGTNPASFWMECVGAPKPHEPRPSHQFADHAPSRRQPGEFAATT